MNNLLEPKIQLVISYIYEKKGVVISDLIIRTHQDIQKLNYAYEYAKRYFRIY